MALLRARRALAKKAGAADSPAMSRPRQASARVLMVQGTSSHAGKSTLVTALCRIFAQDGLRAAPFKAQNMSLNAAVTPDGGEIGRAQMLQAQAARAVPSVDMNPILLKPEAERVSQVVVLGRVHRTESVREYYAEADVLWPVVTAALDRLRARYDVVVVEGAGSPAELNLQRQDLANMRVARHVAAPVILVGDIERGGVFASLIGTVTLLEPEDRRLVRGLVVNKFRGDPSLFEPGPALLERHTGVPVLGVLPFFPELNLPEEDSLGIDSPPRSHGEVVVDVAVIRFPHLANFDDLDPVRRTAGVRVRYIQAPGEFGDPDLVILPGSKTTLNDLAWMRQRGLDRLVLGHRARGRPVIGLCGGFQMLGHTLRDRHGVEGEPGEAVGLGLLSVDTEFAETKTTRQTTGVVSHPVGVLAGCAGASLRAYEIHMGRTLPAADDAPPVPFLVAAGGAGAPVEPDGAIDHDGLTLGTYLHGLFENPAVRRGILSEVARRAGRVLPAERDGAGLDEALDRLADGVRRHLDVAAVYRMIDMKVG